MGRINQTVAVVIAALTVTPVLADECRTVVDDAARLACYDAQFPPPLETEKATGIAVPENGSFGSWYIKTSADVMTDKATVEIQTQSLEAVPGRFGSNDLAALYISCKNDTTSLVIYFGGAFMVSNTHDEYGVVHYRADAKKPGRMSFVESTSNQHLGLWSGGSSIPVIKYLFGAKKLVVQATPFNENPVTLEFDISDVEQAVEPVRKACHW